MRPWPLVLREGSAGAEVLFIERAMRADDPWSGHMAFPGGRLEGGDDSARTAACRETREEVGLELSRAEYLGHLVRSLGPLRRADADDRVGARLPPRSRISRSRSIGTRCARPSGFRWRSSGARRGAPRIGSRSSPTTASRRSSWASPARHFVWGLTYRFLEEMFELIDRPLR